MNHRKKDPAGEVEAALLRRALGTTIRETRREETEKGEKTVTTEKELAPDISAQIFYLKNRLPDRWQDKPVPAPEEPENNLLEILLQAARLPDLPPDFEADGASEAPPDGPGDLFPAPEEGTDAL